MMELHKSGSFEDTVSPRWVELRKRVEWSRAGFDTWDFTASPPEEQREAHMLLDALEQWMDALDAWDREGMEQGRLESFKQTFPQLLKAMRPPTDAC
jgi:hypothetical protein